MHESDNSIVLYAARSGWDSDVSQTAPSRIDGGLSAVFMQKSRQFALPLAACLAHVYQAETRHATHAKQARALSMRCRLPRQ